MPLRAAWWSTVLHPSALVHPHPKESAIMTSSLNTIMPSRAAQLATLAKLVEGLKKHEQTLQSLVIAGQSYKTADLVTVVQARYDAANAALQTKAVWQNAVKADHDERAKTNTFISGLRQSLLVAFAGSIDNLADFGLVPRKKPTLTPEQRVAMAQKAKATRAARHTMGKNQKAQIKGVVPTPSTSPSSPAPGGPAPTTVPTPSTPPVASAGHTTEPGATTPTHS
jgi:hypothetical protein